MRLIRDLVSKLFPNKEQKATILLNKLYTKTLDVTQNDDIILYHYIIFREGNPPPWMVKGLHDVFKEHRPLLMDRVHMIYRPKI